MKLSDLQKRVPNAETVAGRVIAFHAGKHRDFGAYVGEGVVQLSPEGEKLVSDLTANAPAKASKQAPRIPNHPAKESLDPDNVEV